MWHIPDDGAKTGIWVTTPFRPPAPASPTATTRATRTSGMQGRLGPSHLAMRLSGALRTHIGIYSRACLARSRPRKIASAKVELGNWALGRHAIPASAVANRDGSVDNGLRH